ncbi:hypothetical protein [Pseudolysinimonas sp.]|nr:hypothetical protein [Pseudolysinimonas sp.]
MPILIVLAALSAVAVVATIVVVLRDGYRRIPVRSARTLEP